MKPHDQNLYTQAWTQDMDYVSVTLLSHAAHEVQSDMQRLRIHPTVSVGLT